MGLFDTASKTIARARYTAAQGLRSAWYGAHYAAARRRSGGFTRPGEPQFRPTNDVSLPALRKAYFCLLYTSPSPRDATLSRMPSSA